MNPVKLTDEEHQAIDRMRARLLGQGIRISEERIVVALLKAAAKLPEGDFAALIQEGLGTTKPEDDPPAGRRTKAVKPSANRP
jgi:hypothetical protein